MTGFLISHFFCLKFGNVKILSYLCIMKEKLFQSIADFVIKQLSQAESEDAIQFYSDFGMWLDRVAINMFGIYLN